MKKRPFSIGKRSFRMQLFAIVKAANVCAKALKFADEVFVTSVDVIEVADDGFAFGGETSDDEGSPCTQVGGAHFGAVQFWNAGDEGGTAFGLNVGAHFTQFINVKRFSKMVSVTWLVPSATVR